MLHMLGNVSDVPQDLDRAVELLQKIVDKGHPRGQFVRLGNMLSIQTMQTVFYFLFIYHLGSSLFFSLIYI